MPKLVTLHAYIQTVLRPHSLLASTNIVNLIVFIINTSRMLQSRYCHWPLPLQPWCESNASRWRCPSVRHYKTNTTITRRFSSDDILLLPSAYNSAHTLFDKYWAFPWAFLQPRASLIYFLDGTNFSFNDRLKYATPQELGNPAYMLSADENDILRSSYLSQQAACRPFVSPWRSHGCTWWLFRYLSPVLDIREQIYPHLPEGYAHFVDMLLVHVLCNWLSSCSSRLHEKRMQPAFAGVRLPGWYMQFSLLMNVPRWIFLWANSVVYNGLTDILHGNDFNSEVAHRMFSPLRQGYHEARLENQMLSWPREAPNEKRNET